MSNRKFEGFTPWYCFNTLEAFGLKQLNWRQISFEPIMPFAATYASIKRSMASSIVSVLVMETINWLVYPYVDLAAQNKQ
ncbi:hypothetical protein C9I99_21540 [Photobacterium lutimaris]|uniref:Uncharacterized protein n=1 Tax=Photobacterium lutimaris TaxID=388278 RepID=A0A2T3ITT6_9GAMM|nr:hypothetical protein C9I99_21540 [Photobacterium lutimaris]